MLPFFYICLIFSIQEIVLKGDMSALMLASENGHTEIVMYLTDVKALVDKQTIASFDLFPFRFDSM